MLRISQPKSGRHTLTIRLEGQLVGPWVDELRRVVQRFAGNGHRLVCDLTEVTFADRAGVALLVELQGRDVALTGCSPFLQEQMKRPAV